MEDGGHALFESEGFEDVCCSSRETDCRADEGDAEETHVAGLAFVEVKGFLGRW